MISMKTIVFTITMIISAQAFAMEAPPAPPAVNARNAASLRLQELPVENTLNIIRHLADNYKQTTVQDLTALASTNKYFRTLVYDPTNMRAILRTMRPAHAVDLAKRLDNLSVFKNPNGRAAIRGIKRSLVHGIVLREAVQTAERGIFEEIFEEHEADINWPRRLRGETPLISACKLGDPDSFNGLLNNGASLNEQDASGNSALMRATEYGRAEMVYCLLSRGANLYLQNKLGKTAKDIAVRSGFPHIVRILDNATIGAKIYSAVRQNNVERARALVRNKHADVQWRDNDGNTALTAAVNEQNQTLVTMLLQAGANPNAANYHGATPLAWAAYPDNDGTDSNPALVARLLAAGADPNIQDLQGETPLFWAVAQGNIEVLNMLLEAGAKQLLKNAEGKTARSVAIEEGNMAALQALDTAYVNGFLIPEATPESPSKKRKV